MVKAISIRLDQELLSFIDSIPGITTRTEAIKSILSWLNQYKDHYLASIIDYNKQRMTEQSQAP